MSGEIDISKSIYRKSYKLQTATLDQELKEINIDVFKELGVRFSDNLGLLGLMVSLPVIISSWKSMELNQLVLHIEARLKSGVLDMKTASEEKRRRYLENVKEIWEAKYEPKKRKLVDDAMKAGEDSFSEMIEIGDIYEPYQSLLYAGIVFTWSSFEVFMKDLWETALNIGGKHIKKTTLSNVDKLDNIRSDTGIRGKYIRLDYLAKYDYNVANRLGTVLVNKFDFTSQYGIKDAYLCAFPRSAVIKEALEDKGLLQLEARRNIIVHRAGILDATFCEKTGIKKKEIGNKLELSDEELFEFANVTIDVAVKVVKAVSSIILGSKAKM